MPEATPEQEHPTQAAAQTPRQGAEPATTTAADQRRDALRQLAHETLGESADAAFLAGPRVATPATPATPPHANLPRRRMTMTRAVEIALSCALVVALLVAGAFAFYARVGGAHVVNPPSRRPSAFHDFAIPTADSKPVDIARGADGNLWFTEFDGDKIGRITPAGLITEYAVPTPGVGPFLITAAPNGDLWFTEYYGDKIGHITSAGVITELTLPDPASSSAGIATGADGSIWVTAYPGEIERIAPSGGGAVFHLPAGTTLPFAITADRTSNLWFSYDAEATSQDANRIGRMTPAGAVTNYALPTPFSNVDDVVAAPDGNVWFTDYGANMVGYITPTGALHEFSNPSPHNGLNAIAPGPDGALWFTRQDGVIGRMTPTGALTTTTLPTPNSQPDGITAGVGNTLWFTEQGANRIGCLRLSAG